MGQELGLDCQPRVFPLTDRFAEMGGISVHDDGGEQVEHGHAVVLALAGAAAYFALAPDADPLAHVVQGWPRFRRYAPRMLRALESQASGVGEPILAALRTIEAGSQDLPRTPCAAIPAPKSWAASASQRSPGR